MRIHSVTRPAPNPRDAVRDFCAAGRVVWEYPVRDYGIAFMPDSKRYDPPREPRFHGDWGGCEACALLIEQDYKGFTARAGYVPYGQLTRVHLAHA